MHDRRDCGDSRISRRRDRRGQVVHGAALERPVLCEPQRPPLLKNIQKIAEDWGHPEGLRYDIGSFLTIVLREIKQDLNILMLCCVVLCCVVLCCVVLAGG